MAWIFNHIQDQIKIINSLLDKIPSALAQSITIDFNQIWNKTWQFGSAFSARFRSSGSVIVTANNKSNSMLWVRKGMELHVANQNDNTTIVFRPRPTGRSMAFEKIDNLTQQVLLNGIGYPK